MSPPTGRIEFAGPQARRLGYEPEELVGQPVEVLIPEWLDPVHGWHRARFARAPASRSMGVSLPLFARRRDGSELPVEVSLGPAEGGATTVIVVDVSARRQLEGRLRQAEKLEAIGRLAGGIAHDFNNLLTVITGYGGLVEQALAGKPGADDMAEVLRAADRAAQLTGQLLAFSRQQVLDLTELDLSEVTRETLPMLNRLIGEDIRVVLLADDVPAVRADRGLLEQIVVNLAVNARDAMPTGGTLTIEVQSRILDVEYLSAAPEMRPGRYVCLTVTDTGVGIDPETLAHVFEPFFTTKEVGRGTGLGLATVHGIVTQSGGHVRIYSEPGFGTSLKVYLPALGAVTSGAAPEVLPEPDATGRERVLVCEDEPAVRGLIERVLTGRGYDVIAAGDPHEALRRAENLAEAVDLLITDVVLPGMPGPELAERLGAVQPRVPILFISGYSAETIHSRAALPRSSAFLEKPFETAELLREVRRLLDLAAVDRAGGPRAAPGRR